MTGGVLAQIQVFFDINFNYLHFTVVVMSHGVSDMKLVSSDGKLLDYYKDILRFYLTLRSTDVFIFSL